MQKIFEAMALIIAIAGIILALGGLGIWLGKDIPYVIQHAGTISIIGFVLILCAGGILDATSPKPSKATG